MSDHSHDWYNIMSDHLHDWYDIMSDHTYNWSDIMVTLIVHQINPWGFLLILWSGNLSDHTSGKHDTWPGKYPMTNCYNYLWSWQYITVPFHLCVNNVAIFIQYFNSCLHQRPRFTISGHTHYIGRFLHYKKAFVHAHDKN